MPRALFSVSNKTGIVEFGQALAHAGWDIVASGGTARVLLDSDVSITAIEQLTGLPEMLDGRVKTLHPAVHAPILARDNKTDMDELQNQGYAPIDLVVCNLYPFQKTVADPDVSLMDAIENIDIGGVTLLRAAAKNFERVTVVVDPHDYEWIQKALLAEGYVEPEKRKQLAAQAFAHTRDYDNAIYSFISDDNLLTHDQRTLPEAISLSLTRTEELRYGENPHQSAAIYTPFQQLKPLGGRFLQGKPLSYNNMLDADAAWRAASAFPSDASAAVVIVKHLNPTGIAIGENLSEAFERALASDPVSAFGGIIAVNHFVDGVFVEALGTLFVEAIVAPGFSDEACEVLKARRKNCRLIEVPLLDMHRQVEFRSILGGVLVQERDTGDPSATNWDMVSERRPSESELQALRFAWRVVTHVKSNAIVLTDTHATRGIGGGLPSRVDAVQLSIRKAGDRVSGAVMASDAFFPFPDGIEIAAKAGVTAVIQPGGSIRDQPVIDAVNAAGMAMVFTHVRHFRH